jgi:hypothetical protein
VTCSCIISCIQNIWTYNLTLCSHFKTKAVHFQRLLRFFRILLLWFTITWGIILFLYFFIFRVFFLSTFSSTIDLVTESEKLPHRLSWNFYTIFPLRVCIARRHIHDPILHARSTRHQNGFFTRIADLAYYWSNFTLQYIKILGMKNL